MSDLQRRVADHVATSSARARRLRLVLLTLAGLSAAGVLGLLASSMASAPAREQAPAWSPDGRTLVFEVQRDGASDLFISRLDGSARRRLTDTPHDERAPAFSADGTLVGFETGGAEAARSTIDLRSGRVAPVTVAAWQGLAGPALRHGDGFLPPDSREPDWHPDGSRVAFVARRGDHTEIVTRSADGRDLGALVSMAGSDLSSPRWSPDGRRLAFVRTANSRSGVFERGIYVFDEPTGRIQRVSP